MRKTASIAVQLALISLALVSAVHAKERFRLFEVGYNAVAHRTTFSYPDANEKFMSGTSFQGNGIHGSASVKFSEIVSVTARFDHNFLQRPMYFSVSPGYEHRGPNEGERLGASQRAEAVIGFRLSKVGTLEGGAARHSFARRWSFKPFPSDPGIKGRPPKTFDSAQDTISWGPVIGLTREVRVKAVTLGGGIWSYPRMAQGNEWSDTYNYSWRTPETASAVKAEATVAYRLTPRTAVKIGYQFFRTFTPSPLASTWRIDTARTEHAVIARFALTF